MLNLYRTRLLPAHWVAYSEGLGWVMFPAKSNGWRERKAYLGDTVGLMQVPQRLGFNTGFPHPDATPVRALHERVFDEVEARVRRVA